MLQLTLKAEPAATILMLRRLKILVWFDQGQSKFRPPGWCKDPLVFMLGSEQKQPCRSARQPLSATRSTCSIITLTSHCLHSSTPDSRSSPPPQPLVQDTHGRITLFPASTAPHHSSFLFTYSLSFCTSVNDDQHLAVVARH